MEIKFNGSETQNRWAEQIIKTANLTDEQIDDLLRYAGPKMHTRRIMDVSIVIENRHNLAAYADALGEFFNLTGEEKHKVAETAVDTMKMQITAAAAALGSIKSERKAKSSRENGRKGGRPKTISK